MEQEVINYQGQVVNKLSLNSTQWEIPLSLWNISLANRYYLAQQRQGTKKVKKRGEVAGGGAKPWRQKGTGRARSGSIRSPQFRGGGVVFGPTGEENYSLGINKKFKKKVFQSLLGEKMRKKEVVIMDKLMLFYPQKEGNVPKKRDEKLVNQNAETEKKQEPTISYKTKAAEYFLSVLPLKKSKTLIILAQQEENKEKLIRSFRNLPYVNISDSKSVNFQQALYSNYLIFTQEAFAEIEKRLS
ncbi:MAG: 50S ribosomal protein L4 [Candidatus Moeniiplasma glomeromycotorum]|nr:50S ribosomal protein L4 [Candidatus Moeniiplasma glomeromycotorum]MCE8168170.1 50S ribosomal protein L4 [Candidatus Moeniiplasma glomeromycotorum]